MISDFMFIYLPVVKETNQWKDSMPYYINVNNNIYIFQRKFIIYILSDVLIISYTHSIGIYVYTYTYYVSVGL